MEKCILYIVAGFGMLLTPGCYSEYGVIRPHRVVYTSHVPDVHVYRRYRHGSVHWGFWKPHRTHKRYKKYHPIKYKRHKRTYRRNVYNRTTIHRHYYNDGAKNRRKARKGKKYKKGKKRR